MAEDFRLPSFRIWRLHPTQAASQKFLNLERPGAMVHLVHLPGGVPKKGVNKANKDFFPNFSLEFRALKLRFLAFPEGPGGFRELRGLPK